MTKYRINPNPCETCPYRKDTPSGIWDRTEYEKLPQWDDPHFMLGAFLCHNGGKDKETLCRGWLEVHHENLAVRLASCSVAWTEETLKPTTVAVYESGEAAARAGLKRLNNPSRKAREKVAKLLRQKNGKLL